MPTLQLSGKTYRVEMDYNALADAETYMLHDCMYCAIEGRIGFADLRGLLFAATQGQHGIRTPEDAGRLIQANAVRFGEIAQVFAGVIGAAFPVEVPEDTPDGANPPGAEGSNGAISSTLPSAPSISGPVSSTN